jgi:hypothetical protein
VSNELIKYAFTSGEISETLFGRSDLEQYDLGLAKAENWFVDYRGGLSTRPGFEFIDFVMDDDKDTKFFDFRFSPDLANVYVILFGDEYIRFIQDGGYVLEGDETITNIVGDTVTAAGHGYSNGDWIKISGVVGISNINGRTFQVANVAGNDFDLLTVPALTAFVPTGAYTSGGTANRIYTVVSPYAAEDLVDLVSFQRRDLLRLTHKDYPIYNLTRIDQTDWTIEEEVITTGANAPTGITTTPSSAGNAGALFTVTAVLEDGTETIMARPVLLINSVNWTTTAGSVTVKWNVHSEAVSYNIYRSIVVPDDADLTAGLDLGFIGSVTGTQFVDNNIIPDFTKTPPQQNNPFAPGGITSIIVTAVGSGYPQSATVSVAGGGTGFSGFPIVNNAGEITGVTILKPGQDYVNPTVSFAGGGAGATATATAAALTGIFPSSSTIFQQRQMYAATDEEPLTFWASKPRKFSNFDFSKITIDSDSYEFEVDSAEVAPIRHMVPMRGGLVIMSQTGIWQLSGGNSGVVTPTNALADPQTYTGVSKVFPIRLGTDLLYVEGKGYTVRQLNYNEYARVYNGADRSLLSNHLFANNKRIVRWAFAENPFKVVWSVRTDGAFLALTAVPDEKVFAWTPHSTKGLMKDILSILENDADRIYVVVQRYINGRWTKFIERMALREPEYSEDSFAVDCGLTLSSTTPAATISIAAATGSDVVVTASAGVFASGDVGKVLRAGGGKMNVITFTDSTHVRVNIIRPITEVIQQDAGSQVLDITSGNWTLDTPVTSVGGLWHLEGQPVSVLADGNVIPSLTVTDGAITLPVAATRVIVGLKYTCIARSLPPVVTDTVIEARRKRVVGVGTRLSDTRGLKAGRALDSLYEQKERANELWGEPIELFSGIRVQMLDPEWNEEGQTYFVQDNPLPATLLGVVFDLEVGDDTN